LIGAPLGGLLLTQLSDGGNPQLSYFHIIYGVVAALGLISLLIGLVVLNKNLEQPVPQEKRTLKAVGEKFRTGIKEILMDRRVLLSSNMEGVQNLSMGALEAFLPIYAVQVCNFSPFQAGSLWAIQILTTVISKPLMGRWSDRRGRSPLLFGGMFACAIPFALIPWFQNYSILLILAAIFGLGEALVTSSAAALVADFCHQGNLGSAMGTFGTIFDIGHASGPILAGFLISRFGGEDFRLPFVIIAMILIISALAFKIGVKEAKINT
jgi:MFS family permease